MDIGDRVELHSKFTDNWVTGFEVAAVVDGAIRCAGCRTDGSCRVRLVRPTSAR